MDLFRREEKDHQRAGYLLKREGRCFEVGIE